MNNFTKLANEMLREQFRANENYEMEEKPSNDHEFAEQMEALTPEIFDAIHKQDKESHLLALRRYEDIRNKALKQFGIDGLAYLIDPDMASNHSDDYKDKNGIRPKNSTFRDVIEFYSNGNYGRIVNDEYIPNEIVSYIGAEIEDNQTPTMGDLESGIEDLAATASSGLAGALAKGAPGLGIVASAAQQAKQAVKQRGQVYKAGIPAYKKKTEKLKKQFAALGKEV